MTQLSAERTTPLHEPELPHGRLPLEAPPVLERRTRNGGLLVNVIPLLGSVGSIVMVSTMTGAGGRQYLSAGMFLLASIGFVLVQLDRQRRQRQVDVGGRRTDYLRYLAGVRGVVRGAAERQGRALAWHAPRPTALAAVAEEGTRIWERTPADARFLHVRYGVRAQPLALELVPPETTAGERLDPTAASALHRLIAVHQTQPGLPDTADLRAFDTIELVGAVAAAQSVARALVCSATAFHSPDDLLVAVVASTEALAEWEWVKWLPHAGSPLESDAVGPMRMVSTQVDEIIALLGEEARLRPGSPNRGPHILLILDGVERPAGDQLIGSGSRANVTLLDLGGEPDHPVAPTGLRLQLAVDVSAADGAHDRLIRTHEQPVGVAADRLAIPCAEAFARRLSPLGGLTRRHEVTAVDTPVDLIRLLGLGDVRRLDAETVWRSWPAPDRLRVPIGVGEDGAAVHLDLKEAAEQGMGPHGLVVGATGSGKSELLRSLVLGLALTHSSEQLNMVLVDFKGGATFAGMSELPHVSAVITNLASELTLVDRMQDALSGELVRRQELLRQAGNATSLREYERVRTTDPARKQLPPLPVLLVVVDEFSELLAAKPEFIELFVAIGRVGRALGVHLLLASQRLEEGRLRGLESHLSYRVCLRTFSAQESRAVIGVPDSYDLPATPGLGYLKPDPASLQRFRAAYVSGPLTVPGSHHHRHDRSGERETETDDAGILPFTIAAVHPLVRPHADPPKLAPPTSEAARESVLDIAVRRMAGHGPPAHQVWLPPLDEPATLADLMPDLAPHPQLGLVSPRWRRRGGPVVPLGTLDRPRQQRRDTLTIDLAGAGGHVAVVGGPRSGKSTLLRTLLTSTALTTTPLESQFFVLDFGGGTFASLAVLPHVAGVVTRAEPDAVRRVLAEIQGIIDRREAYFRDHGIDSIETYRARRAEGSVDDGYGDVFLLVDGWATLRESFDSVELDLQALAPRALTFGVHIVAAATRWGDFRAFMRDLLGTRLELRLGDPVDSEIDRRTAAVVPPARPGRGIVAEKLHFLGALPRIDADLRPGTLAAGVNDLVAQVATAWPGAPGPKLRLLPERITLAEVRALADSDGRSPPHGPGGRHRRGDIDECDHRGAPARSGLLLGIDERQLAPVELDPSVEPHLLVFGEGRSGKSALLRAYAQEVMRTRSVREAQLVVVDYRRSLLGEIPPAYQLAYLTSAGQATQALGELAAHLGARVPGPDVTAEQLRSRSWWAGAEVFVLVDDYDLVATQQGSPLQVLQPLVAQARDIGFHLVLTRRTGGASRALFEPVIQSLRDLASPGLLLAGSPDEGPLVGNLRPMAMVPGRGRLVTRERGVEVIQTAWTRPLSN